MYKPIRHEKILEEINKNKSVSVNELAVFFDISAMTVKRDLNELAAKGFIRRIHGGAAIIKNDRQSSFSERYDENKPEKEIIAIEAAKLIKNGDVVFFDAGTTPYAVIEKIPDSINITAITTGLKTAVALCEKPNINVITIGGEINKPTYCAVDYLAVSAIKKLRADIAFISTKSVNVPTGTYESKFSLIEIKSAIVSISERIVLVCDYTKFENKSISLAVPMEKITDIITDNKTQKKYIDAMNMMGKNVIVAEI